MKVIATNKRVHFEYFVLSTFTAGISLQGCEVKSVRAGHVSINEAFVSVKNGEAFVLNMYIKSYEHAGHFVPDERRTRKLLLNKSEILELGKAVEQKGLTVVPARVFFEGSLVKLEIAVCRGKKLYDKRQSIKQRDINRDIEREMKAAK